MSMTKPAKVFVQMVGGSIAIFGTFFAIKPEGIFWAALCWLVGFGIMYWAAKAAHPDDEKRMPDGDTGGW